MPVIEANKQRLLTSAWGQNRKSRTTNLMSVKRPKAEVAIHGAVFTLSALFVGGAPPPPEPSSTCGPDPTTDVLGCATFDCP